MRGIGDREISADRIKLPAERVARHFCARVLRQRVIVATIIPD